MYSIMSIDESQQPRAAMTTDDGMFCIGVPFGVVEGFRHEVRVTLTPALKNDILAIARRWLRDDFKQGMRPVHLITESEDMSETQY